jgi:glycerol-3-phosphate dehydrogenase
VLHCRGLRTALIEREDFGSGTSSKSTKLVHGGVRYLEKAVFNLDYGQLKLVYEALQVCNVTCVMLLHVFCPACYSFFAVY